VYTLQVCVRSALETHADWMLMGRMARQELSVSLTVGRSQRAVRCQAAAAVSSVVLRSRHTVAALLSFFKLSSGFDTRLITWLPVLPHHAGCTGVVHLLVTAHLPPAAGVAHSATNSSSRQQQCGKA
jgi:hypothetical protein